MFGIITPPILLFWFYYTRKQNFNNEFLGIYAGYIGNENIPNTKKTIEIGLVLNIRDITISGFFRFKLTFSNIAETEFTIVVRDEFNYVLYRDKIKAGHILSLSKTN